MRTPGCIRPAIALHVSPLVRVSCLNRVRHPQSRRSAQTPQRTNVTKPMAKTALASAPGIEIGVACDSGTSDAGIYGLTDLFTYAGEFAAKRQSGNAWPAVRITHWRVDDDATGVCCTYDSCPGAPHALSLLVIPGNVQ